MFVKIKIFSDNHFLQLKNDTKISKLSIGKFNVKYTDMDNFLDYIHKNTNIKHIKLPDNLCNNNTMLYNNDYWKSIKINRYVRLC